MPGAEFLRAGTAEPDAGVRTVEVLASNWDALAVYQLCQPTVAAGMAVVWLGVSAAELLAACRLLALPRREWRVAAERARHLGELVAAGLNRRTQRRVPAARPPRRR